MTTAYSILMTWIFLHTRGSVLIATLFHGAINVCQGFFLAGTEPSSRYWWLALVYGGAALGLAIVLGTGLSWRRASVSEHGPPIRRGVESCSVSYPIVRRRPSSRCWWWSSPWAPRWVIHALELPNGLRSSALYMSVPAVTVLLMLLVVTRDGYTKTGWASLGLHRLGLRAWGVAIIAPVLVSLVGTAMVWATPLASFAAPEDTLSTIIGFFVQLVLFTVTLSLGEELGWRGYLLPRLLAVGRNRALLVTGLIWAAWHLPLIFLTPLYHADGNRWLVVPLFVATIVAGSFFFGYLRLWTDSTWPAALAHSAHNGAWGILAAFTVTASPVVVDEYLVGDNGVLILIGTVLVAAWLGSTAGAIRSAATPDKAQVVSVDAHQ